jgi:hypothetical protein
VWVQANLSSPHTSDVLNLQCLCGSERYDVRPARVKCGFAHIVLCEKYLGPREWGQRYEGDSLISIATSLLHNMTNLNT